MDVKNITLEWTIGFVGSIIGALAINYSITREVFIFNFNIETFLVILIYYIGGGFAIGVLYFLLNGWLIKIRE